VGLSRQAVVAIESGEAVPRVDVALRIAKVLGVDVAALFSPEPETESHHSATSTVFGLVEGVRVERSLAELALPLRMQPFDDEHGEGSIFVSGCDPILSLLCDRANSYGGPTFRWLEVPNEQALAELSEGRTHVALVHDLPGHLGRSDRERVLDVADWELVLAWRSDLPLPPRDLLDALVRKFRFATRPLGAGVRSYLDSFRIAQGITMDDCGPMTVLSTHRGVAKAISDGRADVGLTTAWVARRFDLVSSAVTGHRSRLVFHDDKSPPEALDRLGSIATSEWLRQQLIGLDGYSPLEGN
jgi:DNA-binding XRE family transcriptional regulator/molybdate-binding protein